MSLTASRAVAVRETIAFITGRFPKLSREEAYMIASIAVDYHVTRRHPRHPRHDTEVDLYCPMKEFPG
jgi:acetamidase/formamidase